MLQPTAPPDRPAGALGHDHRYVARLSGRAAACLQPRDIRDGRVYTFTNSVKTNMVHWSYVGNHRIRCDEK